MNEPQTYLSLWLGPITLSHGRNVRRRPLADLAFDFCRLHGLSVNDLRGPRRTLPLAHLRQAFMERAYATGGYSLPRIGRFLNRDHTTVLHGILAHRDREKLNG